MTPQELRELIESRATKAADLKALVDSAKVDGKLSMTAEQYETFTAKNAELEDIGRSIAAAQIALKAEAEQKAFESELETVVNVRHDGQPVTETGVSRKSVGQMFVESAAYKGRSQQVQSVIDGVDLKVLFQESAGWAPQVTQTGRVVPFAVTPLRLMDFVPVIPTGQAAYRYMAETTYVSAAAERAEGGPYAESQFALTAVDAIVRSVGVSLPVTDEQLADVPGVQSYLNARLGYQVAARVESQILSGTGVAPNLLGVLNTPLILAQPLGLDTRLDAIQLAATQVQATGFADPSCVVIHPTDWSAIQLAKAAPSGMYLFGDPKASRENQTVWGIPVCVTTQVPVGTTLVGDFANYSVLASRQQLELQVGYNAADFVNGIRTLRAGVRVAFGVLRAPAFCTVS
jgi:HK97 family phage major capsid protein